MMIETIETKYRWTNINRQVFSAVIANLVLLGHGTISGWLSPALPILLSKETPLSSGPISHEEMSWLGSISSLGSVVGTILFAGLIKLLGCKKAMMFLGLPSIIFWLSIFFGEAFWHLLAGRFSMGLTAGGVQSGIIIYVSQISDDRIRGRLGSLTVLARNLGVLLAYVVGSFVEYEIIPVIFIYIPIIYTVCLFFLPNTPQYHLSKGNFKDAEKSLKFYKGYEGKVKEEDDALKFEFEYLKNIAERSKTFEKFNMKNFCNRNAVYGIVIGLAMAWFLQLTSCFIVINYAVLVFQKSETMMSPHISAIVLASMQILGGIISASLSDKLGRKLQLIISLAGCAIGLIFFAIFSYIDQCQFDLTNYSNLPVIFLSFVIFIACAGIAPISNVVAVENLPPEIRNAGMVIYTLWYNIVAFLGDKFFPILVVHINLYGCFTLFAVNSFLGTLFVIFCMKETKGQSLNSSDSRISRSSKQIIIKR